MDAWLREYLVGHHEAYLGGAAVAGRQGQSRGLQFRALRQGKAGGELQDACLMEVVPGTMVLCGVNARSMLDECLVGHTPTCIGMSVAGSNACAASSTTSASKRGARPAAHPDTSSPPAALSVQICAADTGGHGIFLPPLPLRVSLHIMPHTHANGTHRDLG
jgi:hypothetical protein